MFSDNIVNLNIYENASPVKTGTCQQTQNICITFVQRQPNVFDVAQQCRKMLYKIFYVYLVPVVTIKALGINIVVLICCINKSNNSYWEWNGRLNFADLSMFRFKLNEYV